MVDKNLENPKFIKGTEKILEQMKKNLFKILDNHNEVSIGSGFFCKIPFINQPNCLSALITSNHIINEEYLRRENEIKIKINEDKNIKILNIKNRFKYTNQIYDITIIEIKENEDNISDFLELDEHLFNDSCLFFEKSIYILHFIDCLEMEKVTVSYGILKSALMDRAYNFINYFCSENYSLGSPLLNLSNYKVLGIHKQKCNNNFHIGLFLHNIIKEFINKYNENRENLKLDKVLKYNGNIENNYTDEITIKYKIEKEKKIRLFGYSFVLNNKKNLSIIINGKERELSEWLDINNYKNNKYLLEIKLKGVNKIINMSYMFSKCSSLISFSNISKMNTINVTDMSHIFHDCSSLIFLPDISKWNTSNVINMSGMFFNCSSLLSLPDLSKWNTNKVNDMRCMFYQCSSLYNIPDISKWNTDNVTNMRCMFYHCLSLAFIPDISKWNICNVTDMSYMLCDCKSLISLPDISTWNTKNVIKINGMFYECCSLAFLPDLSKWNIFKVNNKSLIFHDCVNLINIPLNLNNNLGY